MTTPCALTDETLIALSLDAADDVLASLRLGVAKALDLGTVEGFDQAIVHLAGLLRGKAALSDQAAVKAALEVLDVEWKTTTAEQRKGLIARALEAAGRRTRTVPATLQPVFDKAATEVVRGGRDGVRRGQRLTIAMEFNAIDKRILRHIRTSHLFSVRDEYGRRHEAFGKTARQLVAETILPHPSPRPPRACSAPRAPPTGRCWPVRSWPRVDRFPSSRPMPKPGSNAIASRLFWTNAPPRCVAFSTARPLRSAAAYTTSSGWKPTPST